MSETNETVVTETTDANPETETQAQSTYVPTVLVETLASLPMDEAVSIIKGSLASLRPLLEELEHTPGAGVDSAEYRAISTIIGRFERAGVKQRENWLAAQADAAGFDF